MGMVLLIGICGFVAFGFGAGYLYAKHPKPMRRWHVFDVEDPHMFHCIIEACTADAAVVKLARETFNLQVEEAE